MYSRVLAIILCCLAVSASTASAQLEIDAKLETKRVLQYEPIWINVHIQNNTSHPLHIASSNEEARLVFDIEPAPGQMSKKMKESEILPIVVPPRESVVRRMDLLALYDLRGTGPYTVRTRLGWKSESYISGPLYLDVVPGLEIDRLITESPDGHSFRSFSLRTLYRERREHLFVRVEDKDKGLCYQLYDLGVILRVKKPKMKLSVEGNIEIEHQSGPERFTVTTLSSSGKIIDQKVNVLVSEEDSFSDQSNSMSSH